MSVTAKSRLRLVAGSAKPDPIFGTRPRHELEFLPAALEVVETPAPPLARATALALVGLLAGTIAWASLGQVDIISTAPGRLTPAGGGKVVQPLESGTIAAIRVHDGSIVRKGQVLLELEPTETLADQQRLGGELAAARLEAARLEAVALGGPFRAPEGADPSEAALAQRGAEAAVDDRQAKLAGLDQQIAQHKAELSAAQAETTRLAMLAPLAEQRLTAYQTLAHKGYGAALQLLDARQKAQDAGQSLEVQRQRIPAIQAQILAAERARAEAVADAAKTDLAALAEARVKAGSLSDELAKAEDRVKGRTLTAPVDGMVQELTVHTIGGVVQPGQTLLRVAPSAVGVEVEARLANKDVGFVRAGMPAAIKVETFPFTKYGTVPAVVTDVSGDAVSEPQATPPHQQDGGPPEAQDLHYVVRLRLERPVIMVDDRPVRLTPGMMVQAEIKTGKRRVIEYVLSPLAKKAREAGRER